jgi:RNA polymerase sigma factor (sigma-70 family)
MDWEKTVADLGPRLFKYFNASFASETAADLVQETLIRLVRKHADGEFQSDKGTVTMYAFGIARHVRLESWKSGRKVNLPVDFSPDPDPEDEERVRQLRAFIHELSEVQQQVLSLYIDDELSLNEIAQILAMPVGTVKSHLHRAKETLREKFKGASHG